MLGYWVAAASAWLFGDVNEWTVRLPAALAATALAILMGVWAARWYGRIAGCGAVLAQLTSLYVLVYGRKAEVDMLLCLLTTSALFLIAGSSPDEPKGKRFWRWVGIYAILGLSWLAKFHYGPAMVLGPCVIYFLIQKRFRNLLCLVNPIGLSLFVACVVVWPWLILNQLPEAWDVWREQTVGRALGELGHYPVWFYLPALLTLALPWTPLVLLGVRDSWRRAWKGADECERFLWVWLLVQLAIVSASASKHQNYSLASLPMLSLLVGQAFSRIVDRVRAGELRMRPSLAMATGCLVVVSSFLAWWLEMRRWPYASGPVTATAASFGIGTGFALLCFVRRRVLAGGLALLAMFLCCDIEVMQWILPKDDHRFATAQFGRELRSQLLFDREVAVYRVDQAHGGLDPIVFYLHDPVYRVESKDALAKRLDRDETLYVVTYETRTQELTDIADVEPLKAMSIPNDHPAPKHPPLVLVELSGRTRR